MLQGLATLLGNNTSLQLQAIRSLLLTYSGVVVHVVVRRNNFHSAVCCIYRHLTESNCPNMHVTMAGPDLGVGGLRVTFYYPREQALRLRVVFLTCDQGKGRMGEGGGVKRQQKKHPFD